GVLLGAARPGTLRSASGGLVLEAPGPALPGLGPQPLVLGLPSGLTIRSLALETLRGLLLGPLVGGVPARPPLLGFSRQPLVLGLPLRLAFLHLARGPSRAFSRLLVRAGLTVPALRHERFLLRTPPAREQRWRV